MKREIKFRAWCTKLKEMSYTFWCFNDDRSGLLLLHDNKNNPPKAPDHEYIIMQFTGLKDKNCKEIYEGDIVRYENGETYISDWKGGSERIIERSKYSDGVQVGWDKFEIIGNIYENPEFLK